MQQAHAGTTEERRFQPEATLQRGFTLVEVIISLLLVGIVGSFSLFFLSTGVEGYFISQRAADSAFKAQIALERVRLELVDLDSLEAAPVENVSVQYQSTNAQLADIRMLWFSTGTLYLQVDGADYPLIDQITDPTLHVQYDDMDNDTVSDEVAYIEVGFTIGDQTPYSIRVYPRNMVDQF